MASLHIDRPGIYSFFGSLLQLWCWSCWPRLIRDPAERPTISDALNHPFVEARGVEEMLPLRVWQMFEGNFWFNRLDKILQNSLPGQLAIPWIEVQCLVPARSRSPPSLKMSRRPGWVLQFSAGLADIAFKNACLIRFEQGKEWNTRMERRRDKMR